MQDILHGAQVVCIHFALAATTALTARRMIKIPDEVFRKSLHFIMLLSYIPFAFAFDIWWHSVLVTIILELLIFPALALAEKAGNARTVNTALMGALARRMEVPVETWLEAIADCVPPKTIEINKTAFLLGYEAAKGE